MSLIPLRNLRKLEPAVRDLSQIIPQWTPQFVFEQVGLGHVEPFEITLNNVPVGMALLREEHFSPGTKAMDVWGLWGKPQAPKGWIPAFFEDLHALAHSRGCTDIIATTPRKGWKRLYQGLGGAEAATVYRTEVKYGQ